jgi:Domain of unknown function (DUF1824)
MSPQSSAQPSDSAAPDSFSPESADLYLRQFMGRPADYTFADADRPSIRLALIALLDQSDYQTLGVCCGDLATALDSLNSYLAALDQLETELISGKDLADDLKPGEAIYVKSNTRTGRAYAERYKGAYRGVLVAYQSDVAGTITGTYGHFPLDLFDKNK